VHGALAKHRDDAEAYVHAILLLAPLAWRVKGRLQGYETAYYGLRVGRRAFGAEAVQDLSDYLAGLDQALPKEHVRWLLAVLEFRAQMNTG